MKLIELARMCLSQAEHWELSGGPKLNICYITLARMAKIEKKDDKCWHECEEKRTYSVVMLVQGWCNHYANQCASASKSYNRYNTI